MIELTIASLITINGILIVICVGLYERGKLNDSLRELRTMHDIEMFYAYCKIKHDIIWLNETDIEDYIDEFIAWRKQNKNI